jgi:hypothetical protein
MYSLGMNKEFEQFIELCGCASRASEVLNCTVGMVSHIKTGKRDVSKDFAKLIIDKFPQLSLFNLLYPKMIAA